MLIKPFKATVNASGQALLQVRHDVHGLTWKVYQLGLALGVVSLQAQVAAHVNGIPLASTVSMQQSVFSHLTGDSPYAMESFFVGPPYIILQAGEYIACGVINATAADIFTVGAYVDEHDSRIPQTMGS